MLFFLLNVIKTLRFFETSLWLFVKQLFNYNTELHGGDTEVHKGLF